MVVAGEWADEEPWCASLASEVAPAELFEETERRRAGDVDESGE